MRSAAASSYARVGCYIHDNASPVDATAGSALTIGPDNEIARSEGDGIFLNPADSVIKNNFIHDVAGSCIRTGATASGLAITDNLFVRPGNFGVRLLSDTIQVWHNTFVGGQNAVNLGNVTGIDLRNNIFYGASGYALEATPSQFSQQDYNLFFGSGGVCSGCAAGGNSVLADPLFVNAAGDDYRLAPGSPAIDAGANLGLDVNGARPDTFNGAAPDLGYSETE